MHQFQIQWNQNNWFKNEKKKVSTLLCQCSIPKIKAFITFFISLSIAWFKFSPKSMTPNRNLQRFLLCLCFQILPNVHIFSWCWAFLQHLLLEALQPHLNAQLNENVCSSSNSSSFVWLMWNWQHRTVMQTCLRWNHRCVFRCLQRDVCMTRFPFGSKYASEVQNIFFCFFLELQRF